LRARVRGVKCMKAKYSLFSVIFLFSLSSVDAQENCEDRIVKRVPPKWVNHSERILAKHDGCSINVFYDLSADGMVSVTGSSFEIQDCKRLQKSAEASVNLYRFTEGKDQKCSTKVTFKMERHGT